MRKKNSYLEIYLGSFKKPWEEYCAQLGKKAGAAIREAIAAQLASLPDIPTSPQPVFGQVEEFPDEQAKTRIEVRLTQSEKEKLEILAQHENCSVQVWIINVVRTMLTKQPQCGMLEMEILGESNYQLLSIGRNLNQIAKRLNQGYVQPITLERIEQLQQQINQHTELVSKALRASIERWSLQ
jgi:hypothetical protein